MLKSIIICVILSFTWLDSAQGLCRDVTLDKCEYDQGPFEKVNGKFKISNQYVHCCFNLFASNYTYYSCIC